MMVQTLHRIYDPFEVPEKPILELKTYFGFYYLSR